MDQTVRTSFTPPLMPAPPRRSMKVPALLSVLAVALIAIIVLTFAYLTQRGELRGVLGDSAVTEAALTKSEGELADSKDRLDTTRQQLRGTQTHLGLTKVKLTKTRNRLEVALKRERGLASYGLQTADLLQKKVDCLNVVLDAYNQYAYYVDIGMALERGLNSSTCIGAGIS